MKVVLLLLISMSVWGSTCDFTMKKHKQMLEEVKYLKVMHDRLDRLESAVYTYVKSEMDEELDREEAIKLFLENY